MASHSTPLRSANWGTSYTSMICSRRWGRGIQPPWEQHLGPLQVQRTLTCKHSTLLRFLSWSLQLLLGTRGRIGVWSIIRQGWTGEWPGKLFQAAPRCWAGLHSLTGQRLLRSCRPRANSLGSNPVPPLPAICTRTRAFTSRTRFPCW